LQNKFEKLLHLFGFIIRIHHDARSPERQIIISSNLICKLLDTKKKRLIILNLMVT